MELRETLVLANAFKEGDLLVGGTRDDRVRQDARQALAGLQLRDIRRSRLIDDSVTETLARALDAERAAAIDPLTIAQFKSILLSPDAPRWVTAHRDGLTSESIAAVVKIMSDGELSRVAGSIFNPLPGDAVTIGSPRHFGSRIQPNSPGDSEDEILLSILEGLTFGCGDVIVGLNPASDDLDTIIRLEMLLEQAVTRLGLPTRFCVLSDIVKQHCARERTHVDVGFQSLAGTSAALAGMVGLDADGILDLARSFDGLYFETGQGSAVTNGAAEGVDMVTLEARAYGVARYLQRQTGAWTIVNDVAGFIGPEVFRSVEQLERACLEDVVMAKLHGLTMGLDVCATFHMGISPGALHEVTERIVSNAAPAYLMAVAGNADPMLGYMTTSFREHPALRQQVGKQTTSAMQRRFGAGGPPDVASLYAAYAKAGGDRRTAETLADEGRRKLREMREGGFDVGREAADAEARLQQIYQHARQALYGGLDDAVLRDASPRHARVQTTAADREDYLAHPATGERLRPQDARAIAQLYDGRSPHVLVVVSDGLNAHAVNEHLRAVLPLLRRQLLDRDLDVGHTDVVVTNGRVRAGYQIGGLADASIVVHLIGERPGTGLNTLSAYVTYGRDERGRTRWRGDLDHSCTTAVCGIHPRGKRPAEAVNEIARVVARILAEGRSGVALHGGA